MSGRVVHFEIPADDVGRAAEFYRSAFGWQLDSMPSMEYTIVRTGPTNEQGIPSEPGAINGGMLRRQGGITSPVVTIDVDDMDAALETVQSRGGSVVIGKQPVEDMGFAAYFTDTEGNRMGLWQTRR